MNTRQSYLLGLGCPDCGGTCGSTALAGLGSITFNTQPTSDWNCNDWITWHQELVKAFVGGKFASGIKYSQNDALIQSKKVFLEWWNKVNSIWSTKIWCGYESSFAKYFQSVGIPEIVSYIASVVNPVKSAVQTVATGANTVVDKTVDAATDAAGAAANVTKTVGVVLPIAIVVGVAGIGWWAYKRFIAEPKNKSVSGLGVHAGPKSTGPKVNPPPQKKKPTKRKPTIIHLK